MRMVDHELHHVRRIAYVQMIAAHLGRQEGEVSRSVVQEAESAPVAK